jgi:cytochrome bd-type quinol oxidase subunit 1
MMGKPRNLSSEKGSGEVASDRPACLWLSQPISFVCFQQRRIEIGRRPHSVDKMLLVKAVGSRALKSQRLTQVWAFVGVYV